jgi:hypothetical protein
MLSKEADMKLSEGAKIYEKCMKKPDRAGHCDKCPFYKTMVMDFGDEHDESGKMIWKIQAFSMMEIFTKWLEDEKV